MVEARGAGAPRWRTAPTPCTRSSCRRRREVQDGIRQGPSSRRGLQDHDFRRRDRYDPPVLVSNKDPANAPLKVVKAGAETGKRIPLAASFRTVRRLRWSRHPYPPLPGRGRSWSTWTTNERGGAHLPPMALGRVLLLKEVAAPGGATSLIPSRQPLRFPPTTAGWDDPIVLTFGGRAQKGTVTVSDQLRDGVARRRLHLYREGRGDVSTPTGSCATQTGRS